MVRRRHGGAWRWVGAAVAVCAITAMAACSDSPSPTGPSSVAVAARTAAFRSADRSAVEVVCAIGYATDDGAHPFAYGRVSVNLPAASRAANGARRLYVFRNHAGGQVVGAAHCSIPATELALAHMDRFFGTRARGGVRWTDGGSRLTDADGTLDRIHVYACQYGGEFPYCEPPPMTWPTYTPKELQICYINCGGGADGGGSSRTLRRCAIHPSTSVARRS